MHGARDGPSVWVDELGKMKWKDGIWCGKGCKNSRGGLLWGDADGGGVAVRHGGAS